MKQDGSTIAPFRRARCPMCKRDEVETFRPFCSKRCADADLSQWLTGGYAVPTVEGEELHIDGEADFNG